MSMDKYSNRTQGVYKMLRVSDIEMRPSYCLRLITGFEDKPIVSLEDAVKPLLSILPAVDMHAYAAKQLCKKPPPDGLTIDESASIMLYSMGWQPLTESLSYALNSTIGPGRPEELEIWHDYLKLFLTALSRLPPAECTVYRAVNFDVSPYYVQGNCFTWRGFSSCTNSRSVFQSEYIQPDSPRRSIFSIKCQTARDITQHCYLSNESEFILLPDTRLGNHGIIFQSDDLCIFSLEEYKSPIIFNCKFYDERLGLSFSDTDESNPEVTQYIIKHTSARVDQNLLTTQDSTSDSSLTVQIDTSGKKKWKQNGITIAGGNGEGSKLDQLFCPSAIYIHDDQTLYIVDSHNHRIVAWKSGASKGELVAGGLNMKSKVNQLDKPVDIAFDRKTNSFIIADSGNNRVVRWSLGAAEGDPYIHDIQCTAVAIDEHGYLYVCDEQDNCVRRWLMKKNDGTANERSGYVFFLDEGRHDVRPWQMDKGCAEIVAGGNGRGQHVSQLSEPNRIFIDHEESIYVTDRDNHRVMKWKKGATAGIVVAGGHGQGASLKQLSDPQGIFVDELGDVYVVDTANCRVVCWPKGAEQGYVVVGNNGEGAQADQLHHPQSITFDQEGNLYVADSLNHQIKKFNLVQS